MKPFFLAEQSASTSIDTLPRIPAVVGAHASIGGASPNLIASRGFSDSSERDFRARVAVYDTPSAAPRVEDVRAQSPNGMIDSLSQRVYELARGAGGEAPYTVLREVVENLIHADFEEIVVSILDSGRTVRFADQGPGITDKNQAVRPGFTTASTPMKDFIRGVGSGLPIVSEFLTHKGGSLVLEDNLGRGTVVTLDFAPEPISYEVGVAPAEFLANEVPIDVPVLSLRQKKVLSLVMELGEVGPTLVSKELGVGLSTAYRDLASLEDIGLIDGDESGKRILTTTGSAYIGRLFD